MSFRDAIGFPQGAIILEVGSFLKVILLTVAPGNLSFAATG